MTTKEKAVYVVDTLKIYYSPTCSLNYKTSWQLLIAARLSAQCLDSRVNDVTEELFETYPDMQKMAIADLENLYRIIRPCGLFRVKADNVKNLSIMLIEKFNGKIPDTLEQLLELPGIGRKTANLILGDVFKKPAIVADAHCIRITNRLGLVNVKDPHKLELMLKEIIQPEEQNDFCHRLVHFGRDKCKAINPQCGKCPLSAVCDHFKLKNKS